MSLPRLAAVLLACAVHAPALAQDDAHAGHAGTAEPAAVDPHAGHVMPAEPTAAADPHAGHVMPSEPSAPAPAAVDQSADDAAPIDHSAHGAAASPAADVPPPPEAFSGPVHAADTVFDPQAMARTRELLRAENGNFVTWWLMVDELEAVHDDDGELYAWNAQGWYGGDTHKLWLKTEGEGAFDDELEAAELQLLWSRAARPFFDFQAGLRQDFEPGPSLTHAVVGLQGLVPYEFELDAAAYLSEHGDVTARLEFEYDLRITQRLVLQPRIEMNFALQDIPELDTGSGLSAGEFGLRLRYEFMREFAPYAGVRYERMFGDTGKLARAGGADASGWNFVVGLRAWY